MKFMLLGPLYSNWFVIPHGHKGMGIYGTECELIIEANVCQNNPLGKEERYSKERNKISVNSNQYQMYPWV
jgi:hypothetical protein